MWKSLWIHFVTFLMQLQPLELRIIYEIWYYQQTYYKIFKEKFRNIFYLNIICLPSTFCKWLKLKHLLRTCNLYFSCTDSETCTHPYPPVLSFLLAHLWFRDDVTLDDKPLLGLIRTSFHRNREEPWNARGKGESHPFFQLYFAPLSECEVLGRPDVLVKYVVELTNLQCMAQYITKVHPLYVDILFA